MSINKNVAVFVGLALALAVVGMASPVSAAALTQAQVDAIIGLLQSFGADQSTISNVQASLTGGTPTGGTGGTVGSYVFNTNLTMGSKGVDVTNLQKVLNSDADTIVAASGVGSAGNESSYFGALTKSAVIKFQKKYGITPAEPTPEAATWVSAFEFKTFCRFITSAPVLPIVMNLQKVLN